MKNSMVELSNGYELPPICYGTDIVPEQFFSDNSIKQHMKRMKYKTTSLFHGDISSYRKKRGIIDCTNKAVSYGCTFFDTSRAYGGSELMLKDLLKNTDRNDVFICTKLRNRDQLNGRSAKDCLAESLKRLGTSYVDLYLIHWPITGSYLDYWKQLVELYNQGLCKAIGVSNCKIHHLEEIASVSDIVPMVNEIELHPLLTEFEIRQYCKQHGIVIMAYSSTARMDFRLKRSKRMETICKRYNKSLSQIIIRWHIQNGIIPIFNTSSVGHFRSNMEVFDFSLSEDDMRVIEGMNINSRTRYDSDNCEWERL